MLVCMCVAIPPRQAFGSEWGGDAVHKASMELVQAIPTSVELRVLIDPLEKALANMLEMETRKATAGELLAMMEILNVIGWLTGLAFEMSLPFPPRL